MLRLQIPETEFWDDEEERFYKVNPCILQLEHSLISLSRWECKYKRPFLSDDQKTVGEIIDYVRMMTITKTDNDLVYTVIQQNTDLLNQIKEYLDDSMTATTFALEEAEDKYNPKKSVITAEIIYYWMVTFRIPPEYEKWHLNRLFTLIRVCSIKNSPQKKRSRRDVYQMHRELNAKRRAAMNSTG